MNTCTIFNPLRSEIHGEGKRCRDCGQLEPAHTMKPQPPFCVGDAVAHSDTVILRARDYWLSCGREPMKSGAKADLDKKTAARGTVETVAPGTHTAWVIGVEWDDGQHSRCLPYLLQHARLAAPAAAAPKPIEPKPARRILTEASLRRFTAARASFNYCGICGHEPKSASDEPNRAPLRWWDCDDGWKIGTLCRGCAEDCLDEKPKPGDFASHTTNGTADDVNTDEDPILAL